MTYATSIVRLAISYTCTFWHLLAADTVRRHKSKKMVSERAATVWPLRICGFRLRVCNYYRRLSVVSLMTCMNGTHGEHATQMYCRRTAEEMSFTKSPVFVEISAACCVGSANRVDAG